MLKAFFRSRQWALWAYGGGAAILGSFCLQAYLALQFNFWQKTFYDMVQNGARYTRDDFLAGIMRFVWIVSAIIMIGAVTNYFRRIYVLRWREAVTFHYIPLWRNVQKDVENANQRIQDDTFAFVDIMTGLGISIFDAIVSLIVFIPLLWGLNQNINIDWIKNTHGCLVWLALAAGIVGTIISRLVGARISRWEYNKQRVEADFRSELVLGEKVSKERHAQEKTLVELFGAVRSGYHSLYLHLGLFEIWNNSFTQSIVILPFLILSENILAGVITWGAIQQIINALDQVCRRFSFLIDHWPILMNLKSVKKRLTEFEKSLTKYNS